MRLFTITEKSSEKIWEMMKHLNLLILLYITIISYHAVMGMAQSNSAGLFLRTIPVLPMASIRFVAVIMILYTALLMLFNLDVEDVNTYYVKMTMEMVISILLIYICGKSYSGVIILVMADIIRSRGTGQNKLMILAAVTVVYFVVESAILDLWIRNVSFSDYLIFYDARAAGVLQSALNIAELTNGVLFILFLIVTLRYQMDETARIKQLNEELTEANILLEDFSRKSAEMAQTKERNRLAREIHDTIGHSLTGIVTGLEACLVLLDVKPELARKQMEAIQDVAKQGMTDVRRSVHALRPDVLETLTLSAAIERMVDEMCRSTGILFKYVCDDPLEDLAQDEEDIVYRVVQESITNSVRHGHPSRIDICIERKNQRLRIQVRDDGEGCEEPQKGFGLTHMQERLDMLGGNLELDGRDGFTLTAEVPLRLHTEEGQDNDQDFDCG